MLFSFELLFIAFTSFFLFLIGIYFQIFLLLSTSISYLCTTFVTNTKTIKTSNKRIGLSLNPKYETKGLKQE
jgi:hypothetical protein